MDSTALRYFAAVARTGSVQAAGEVLHVAGSAISRQIAGLEAQLGIPLFERHARGMRLTHAGEILANHARRQELENERVSADLQRLRGHETAVLRITAVEGTAQYAMPMAIARLQRLRPGVHVKLSVLSSRLVTERVRSGEADIGIAFSLAPQPEIRVLRRLNGAIMAFASTDHAYAGRSSLTLKDLEKVPMFLMGTENTVRQLFDMACAHEGVAVKPVLETTSSATIHQLVLTGAGLSIASFLSMVKHVKNRGVVALPLAHPILEQRSIQVQVLTGRRLPMIVEEFLQCLDEVISDIESFAPGKTLRLPD